MVPTQDIFIGQTYFVGSNGQQIPLKVESVDFNPGYIGPEIHGYLFRDFEVAFSKKSDSQIKKVIFNDPATIVIWSDDSKTVVKCQPGDTYSKELGLAMCISKKYLGNKGNFNEEFKKWIPEEPTEEIREEQIREILEGNISEYDMNEKIRKFCLYRSCNKCPIYQLPGRSDCKVHCYGDVKGKALIENYNAIKDLL